MPGGRVEGTESGPDAVRREVREETGLDVEVGPLLGVVDVGDEHEDTGGDGAASGTGTVFEVADYRCTVRDARSARAGDDAAEVRWVSRAEYDALAVVPGLTEALASAAPCPVDPDGARPARRGRGIPGATCPAGSLPR